MKYRTVKITPEGRQPRQKVREVVRGVHVVPLPNRRWQVRTIGLEPVKKVFPSKDEAIDFAESLGRENDLNLVLHKRRSKPADLRKPARAGH